MEKLFCQLGDDLTKYVFEGVVFFGIWPIHTGKILKEIKKEENQLYEFKIVIYLNMPDFWKTMPDR